MRRERKKNHNIHTHALNCTEPSLNSDCSFDWIDIKMFLQHLHSFYWNGFRQLTPVGLNLFSVQIYVQTKISFGLDWGTGGIALISWMLTFPWTESFQVNVYLQSKCAIFTLCAHWSHCEKCGLFLSISPALSCCVCRCKLPSLRDSSQSYTYYNRQSIANWYCQVYAILLVQLQMRWQHFYIAWPRNWCMWKSNENVRHFNSCAKILVPRNGIKATQKLVVQVISTSTEFRVQRTTTMTMTRILNTNK